MQNNKRAIAFVLAGMMLGTLLTGSVASATEQLTAQRSTQRFYVDGERVQMEAYTIDGSNYVKLRDIGRMVGFNVTWDAEINGAMIDTNIPYEDDDFTMAADTVVLSTDGSKFIPKVGDKILCDDGYIYEITDTLVGGQRSSVDDGAADVVSADFLDAKSYQTVIDPGSQRAGRIQQRGALGGQRARVLAATSTLGRTSFVAHGYALSRIRALNFSMSVAS